MIEQLKTYFAGVKVPIWLNPEHAAFYTRLEAGRKVVMLDEEATRMVLLSEKLARPSRHFEMLTIEGSHVGEAPDWPMAVCYALERTQVVYNGKMKKFSRPVWDRHIAVEDRVFENLGFEPIRPMLNQGVVTSWFKKQMPKRELVI